MFSEEEKEDILERLRASGEAGHLMRSEVESFKAIEYLLTLELPEDTAEHLWDCLSKGLINLALASTLYDLKLHGFVLPDEHLLPIKEALSKDWLSPDEEDLLEELELFGES
ncbi:MAG: hypothetical protein Q4D73_07500 [Actinomycetaceae bacterium]|nr:hypothetical protein [Actinomycetaceae bacterium]